MQKAHGAKLPKPSFCLRVAGAHRGALGIRGALFEGILQAEKEISSAVRVIWQTLKL